MTRRVTSPSFIDLGDSDEDLDLNSLQSRAPARLAFHPNQLQNTRSSASPSHSNVIQASQRSLNFLQTQNRHRDLGHNTNLANNRQPAALQGNEQPHPVREQTFKSEVGLFFGGT
jgi:hypothetical protein